MNTAYTIKVMKIAIPVTQNAGMQIYYTEAERVVELLEDLEGGMLPDFPDSALCSHGNGHGQHHGEHCHEHHE